MKNSHALIPSFPLELVGTRWEAKKKTQTRKERMKTEQNKVRPKRDREREINKGFPFSLES